MRIPFDIKFRPQIESGEYKVETRDGRPARIVCWDLHGDDYPIIALIGDYKRTTEILHNYKKTGEFWIKGNDTLDLFLITPDEEPDEEPKETLKNVRKEAYEKGFAEGERAERSFIWDNGIEYCVEVDLLGTKTIHPKGVNEAFTNAYALSSLKPGDTLRVIFMKNGNII